MDGFDGHGQQARVDRESITRCVINDAKWRRLHPAMPDFSNLPLVTADTQDGCCDVESDLGSPSECPEFPECSDDNWQKFIIPLDEEGCQHSASMESPSEQAGAKEAAEEEDNRDETIPIDYICESLADEVRSRRGSDVASSLGASSSGERMQFTSVPESVVGSSCSHDSSLLKSVLIKSPSGPRPLAPMSVVGGKTYRKLGIGRGGTLTAVP